MKVQSEDCFIDDRQYEMVATCQPDAVECLLSRICHPVGDNQCAAKNGFTCKHKNA